ncbi:MAG: NAD kinase [Flavobacteriaceae bacterium]|nr:NAD kinase [Flavobacteriaceae bacterium]
MKIAIYSQYSGQSIQVIQSLIKQHYSNPVEFFLNQPDDYEEARSVDVKSLFEGVNFYDQVDSSFKLMVSVGGDGTILRAATYLVGLTIPIVGINTGKLGFLATIASENILQSFEEILQGNFLKSKRSLIEVSFGKQSLKSIQPSIALNEIAVSRRNTTSMITIKTYLNDEYLTSYWADGLIISTPTGSTGYSLSCGGPVIAPGAEAFVITPIAPHNLNARPLVIKDSTAITLQVFGREEQFLLSLDNRIYNIPNEITLRIKKSNDYIELIHLTEEGFIPTLRKKLLWGEDKRN